MKNRLFLFVLFAVPVLLSGQSVFKIGVRAGFNYSNQVIRADGNTFRNNDYRPDFHGGIATSITFSKKFSLSPELMHSGKGYYYKGDESFDPPGPSNVHFNYLVFPVWLNYRVISGLSVKAGPEVGYLLSARSKFKTETIDLQKFPFANGLYEVDLGIGVGLAYSVLEKISIDVRYIRGVTSLYPSKYILTDEVGNKIGSERVRTENRTFQLSVAYFIN